MLKVLTLFSTVFSSVIILLLASACFSNQKKESNTQTFSSVKIKFPPATVWQGPLKSVSARTIIWANRSDGPERMGRVLQEGGGETRLDLHNGRWHFYAIQYDASSYPFSGTMRCEFLQDIQLMGGTKELVMTLNRDKCTQTVFGDSQYRESSTGLFYPLRLLSCRENFANSATSTHCNDTSDRGRYSSFQVVVMDYMLTPERLLETDFSLSSTCYAVGAGASYADTSIMLPAGQSDLDTPFFIKIFAFESNDCSGSAYTDYEFRSGVRGGVNRNAMVYPLTSVAKNAVFMLDPAAEETDDGDNGSADISTDTTPTNIALTVYPVYPIGGETVRAKWTYYVKDDGSTFYNASGSDCTVANGVELLTDCLHTGEYFKVPVTGVNSCQYLSLVDDQRWQDWQCVDSSGTATFYSKGFAENFRLHSLLENSSGTYGWRRNRVAVFKTAPAVNDPNVMETKKLGESSPAKWWANPVRDLTDDGASADPSSLILQEEGTVYVRPVLAGIVTLGTKGYNINADHISVLIAPNGQLTYLGSSSNSANVNLTTGETTAASACALIAAGGQQYLWIEGNLDSSYVCGYGLYFYNSHFSVVNRSIMKRGIRSGITINSSSHNLFHTLIAKQSVTLEAVGSDGLPPGGRGVQLLNSSRENIWNNLKIEKNQFHGLEIRNESDQNIFDGLRIAGNLAATGSFAFGAGIMLDYSHENRFQKTVVEHHQADGIVLRAGRENRFQQLIVSNNSNVGVWDEDGDSNLFSQTISSLNGVGFYLKNTQNTILLNAMALSNMYGFKIENYTTSVLPVLANIVAYDNSYNNIYATANSGTVNDFVSSVFWGKMAVNGSGSCQFFIGGSNGTCSSLTANSSQWQNISTSGYGIHKPSQYSFAGRVLLLNDADENVPYIENNPEVMLPAGAEFAWSGMNSSFRSWHRDAYPLPFTSSHRGPWSTLSGNLRQWDWSLKISDPNFLLRTVGTISMPLSTCPMDGNRVVTDNYQYNGASERTFLLDAVEIFDGGGDNDGLCESLEPCLFMPNYGVYQGEVDGNVAENSCQFTDGTVYGSTIYYYPTQGKN